MSGIETALGVYGLITGTITIVETSIKIYDAVKDKSGIPEKLKKISDKLPALLELLEGARAQAEKFHPTEQTWIEVKKAIQHCREACEGLQYHLESVYQKADAGTTARVFKNIGNVISDKSKTAEGLLKEIYTYLEILKHHQIITNAKLLDDIKKTVDELFPTSGITQNNVSGTNVGHNNGQINNQTGGSGH